MASPATRGGKTRHPEELTSKSQPCQQPSRHCAHGAPASPAAHHPRADGVLRQQGSQVVLR